VNPNYVDLESFVRHHREDLIRETEANRLAEQVRRANSEDRNAARAPRQWRPAAGWPLRVLGVLPRP
jgi:hypothetical protein